MMLDFQLQAQQVTTIWQELCERHYQLLELTTREYSELLSSDLESLEQTVSQKDDLLKEINLLEDKRCALIKEMDQSNPHIKKISCASELIEVLNITQSTAALGETLEKQNTLLINLINDIRIQNRKNQSFLNKAINSLQTLRAEMSGEKTYSSYGPKGSRSSLSVRP